MADFSRSSFIPKETTGAVPSRVRRRRTFHIFGFIATTMLVGSLALAAGVYFLKTSAQKGLDDAKQSLIEQDNLFKQESISEVREFDRKLKAAELLINNHISPLKIFAALEKETKQKVQFTAFEVEHTPTLEVILNLQGTTPEFKSLALQEITFSENGVLRDVVFSEVSTNDGSSPDRKSASADSSINFNLKGTLSPDTIPYDGVTPTTIISADTNALFTSAVLGDSITIE